jgi:hypothetical protein
MDSPGRRDTCSVLILHARIRRNARYTHWKRIQSPPYCAEVLLRIAFGTSTQDAKSPCTVRRIKS